jgi:poly(3-hydroxyalkanoate) synthetase
VFPEHTISKVVQKLYKLNELARELRRPGQNIDLKRLRLPMYLLAGSADEVVTPGTIVCRAAAGWNAAAAPPPRVAPCNHLGLFMGRQTPLEEYWPRIVRWMKEPLGVPDEHPSRPVHRVRTAKSKKI